MIINERISRRGFLATGAAAILAPSLHGCLGPEESLENLGNPVLTSRPGNPTKTPQVGASDLGLESGRDGLLYVPASYNEATPAPLVVAFHGSGGNRRSFDQLFPEAEARGFVMLVPESRAVNWDLVRGPFRVDPEFIDRALAYTFDRCRISADRIAIMGFSDGGSYALSLGVSNGNLANSLIAFSPSFYDPVSVRYGRPQVFVSHGVADTVVPINRTRDFVGQIRGEGYLVEFVEFQGGHEMPTEITTAALDWFLG